MHIVINAIPLLSRQTGVGNCIYNISKALLALDKENKYTFYYGYFSERLQEIEGGPNELTFSLLQKSKPYIKKIRFLGELSKKAIEVWNKFVSRKKKFDVYFEPNYIPANLKAKKLVTTVHDFSFHLYPQWHPRDRIEYFRKYFYSRINRSDLIVTDSEYIKHEARQYLEMPEERVRVVHMGYDDTLFRPYTAEEIAAFKKVRQLPEKYVLFVGSIEPRKNIERLLLAYQRLPRALRQEYKLVLSGFSGWRNKKIMELINHMQADVQFLGYLELKELALVYNGAGLFAYPSLYEGFGLPPLEAMACGTPVLVSNVASLPEVCGLAAAYCDPLEVDDISDKLTRLLEDESLRLKLAEKGRSQARQFTWRQTAREMMKLFQELQGGRE